MPVFATTAIGSNVSLGISDSASRKALKRFATRVSSAAEVVGGSGAASAAIALRYQPPGQASANTREATIADRGSRRWKKRRGFMLGSFVAAKFVEVVAA